ncbi:MAG TPA: PhzF family phenazine biosynthesis protein, partial [Telluria sp.]|nr:PhzF family phenazine biosynthesis protein [Telluria sp.]
SRAALAAMRYDFEAGRALMQEQNLVTILLVYAESDRLFHTRNPFAYGGVYEDPATGASSAAFAGYLRELDWPHAGAIDIVQGEDMGCPSRIHAQIGPDRGSSIRLSGTARIMEG